MFTKLRFQLSFSYSLGILAAILFLLLLFYSSTQIVFYRQVDETLNQHVKALADSVKQGAQQSGCGCLSSQSTFLSGVLQMPGMPTAILDENKQIIKSSTDFNQAPSFISSLPLSSSYSQKSFAYFSYLISVKQI